MDRRSFLKGASLTAFTTLATTLALHSAAGLPGPSLAYQCDGEPAFSQRRGCHETDQPSADHYNIAAHPSGSPDFPS